MELVTLQDTLAKFGITQTRNTKGELGWTLEVTNLESGTQSHTARFNEILSRWELDIHRPNDSHLIAADASNASNAQQTANLSPHGLEVASRLTSDQWVEALPLSDHTDFFRRTNWHATPLGPFERWPHALRLSTHMLFSDSRAAAIYWGPQRTAVYNQNLIPLIGRIHPVLMGQSFETVMPDLWDFFGPIFYTLEKERTGQLRKAMEASLERYGYPEETWWDGALIPLRDDHGDHGGVYFSWIEVTRTVLRDRRTALVNRLGQSSLVDTSLVWRHIYEVLADSPRDIPMAIIYSAEDSESFQGQLNRQYMIGASDVYAAAPPKLNINSFDNPSTLELLFRRATDSPTDFLVIDLLRDDIPSDVFENVNWQGYGQPSRHFVVMPLQARNVVKGYIMFGLNPRRDYDHDHEQFISDFARQLRELMTRISTEEESHKREQRLMEQLTESERRINRLVKIAPAGIYDLGADGSMLWANDHFFEIMGVASESRNPSSFKWQDYIFLEDQGRANAQMFKSLVEKVEISDTLRLQRRWKPPAAGHGSKYSDEATWVMYSALPDINEDGSVRSLMGCIIDISHLKWAEKLQAENANAAEREKQRQEEFIDITSHEMRNPLSAITQCADDIITSLHDIKDANDAGSLIEIIKHNVEAAESISFCATHQRRIIDDILTLGKMDSKLLTITPTVFNPRHLVDEVLQMFKAEFESSDIEARKVLDDQAVLDSASNVYGDASRLLQVLVNLLTNAIKFTRSEKTRRITIYSGSSSSPPTTQKFGANFNWFSTEKSRPDMSQEADYGGGEVVYLYYSIVDSGRGIPGDFANKVFSKFEQADRRTHVKYGGSGLGLFISRELTEMQGGRIGIESKEAVGSTFAFYIKARRTQESLAKSTSSAGYNHAAAKAMTELESQGLSKSPHLTRVENSVRLNRNQIRNYNVLLVEDNLLNQKVLAKQLIKAGCIVNVANHGGEALEYMVKLWDNLTEGGISPADYVPGQLDCILMDWEMPICDGLTATKRIREMEAQVGALRNIIIGITANARPEQVLIATKAGMDKVVPKPFRVPELLAEIGRLIPLGHAVPQAA